MITIIKDMFEVPAAAGKGYHIEAETKRTPFSSDILKGMFLNENVLISIKISLKVVPKGPINNSIGSDWLGAGQATSHCLNQWWLVYWRRFASLSLNELCY